MANTTKRTTAGAKNASAAKKTAAGKAASRGKSVRSRQTEFAQEQCRLTDYDIISDVLGSHKNIIKLYGTALCEIDSVELRGLVTSKMTECAEDQLDAFLYMSERGLYKTEPAPIQKVKEARQRFCTCLEKIKK